MKVRSKTSVILGVGSGALVATALGFALSAGAAQKSGNQAKDAPALASQATFSARSELVLVPAIVTDGSGAHVANLSKDDFSVLENGVEQKIATFEEVKATAAPVHRAMGPAGEFSNLSPTLLAQPRRVNIIVLDLINTPFSDQAYARRELMKYLAQSISSGDLTTLLTMNRGGIKIVVDFTTDPAVLVAALKKVRGTADLMAGENVDAIAADADAQADPTSVNAAASSISDLFTHMEAESARFQQQISTQATLDAFEGIANAYAGVPGRKALIWMTAAFPFDLPKPGDIHAGIFMTAYQRVFEKLNNANIAVYPVDARGLVYGGPSAADRITINPRNPGGVMRARMSRLRDSMDTMNTFADMTGGRAFYNTNDLTKAVARASEDSASYYVLGYYLKNDLDKPGWRKLQVKVKRGGTHVRARNGFFVVRQPGDTDRARSSELIAAVRSPFDFTGLPLTVRWGGRGGVSGAKKNVDFDVLLNANTVTTDEADNNHVSLEFVAVARDATLNVADQISQHVESHAKPETVAKLKNSGMTYHNRLSVAPGDYTVRFVVRDNLSGRLGSLLAPLKVE
jgi:VWFA-related protein